MNVGRPLAVALLVFATVVVAYFSTADPPTDLAVRLADAGAAIAGGAVVAIAVRYLTR